MSTRLDTSDIRRANPARPLPLPMPTLEVALEVVRKRAIPGYLVRDQPTLVARIEEARRSGTCPSDRELVAIAFAGLEAGLEEQDEDAANDALVVWILVGAGADVAVAGLARSAPLAVGKKAPSGFRATSIGVWKALARALGAVDDEAYAAARDVARKLREQSKEPHVRSALAMLFPAESWATDDARSFDPKKHDRGGGRWFESASMLLFAVNEIEIASALVDRLVADKSGHGTFSLAEPAFALVHRFGDRAAPMLLSALSKTRKERDDGATATLISALAYLDGPEVTKAMEAFRGKKLAADAVMRFFARVGSASTTKSSGDKVAVVGDLDFFGAVGAWKKMPLHVTASDALGAPATRAATVGAAIEAWEKDHGVRTRAKKGEVSVRGVIDRATMRSRGAELAAIFRIGEDLAAERRVHFQGQLFFYVVGAGEGVPIDLYERGESSIESIEDSMDDDAAVHEALG